MSTQCLVVIPVHNEKPYLKTVLRKVLETTDQDVLTIDDGSQDQSKEILNRLVTSYSGVQVIRNATNQGYGYALTQGFNYSIENDYQYILTMDADGQHPPRLIPQFIEQIKSKQVDIVSGSRYLPESQQINDPPADHLEINQKITAKINELTAYNLTDSFCGYKIYNCEPLAQLNLTHTGYGMPLELWLQADHYELSVTEFPVPVIYNDGSGDFTGELGDPEHRLNYYREVIEETLCSMSSS